MNDIICKLADSKAKAVNNAFKGGKDLVLEPHFSELFPNLFDWIHFRSIGRNEKEFNVFRNFQSLGLVPSSTVAAKQNNIVLVLFRQFPQKYIHTVCVAIRHYKKEIISVKRFNCSIGISVFPDVMTWNNGTSPFLTPAILWLVDPAKSCFVLKQQMDSFLC